MAVRFLTHPVATKVGEQVMDVPTEFIEVTFVPTSPGVPPDVMFRPSTEEDRARFKAAYREFKPVAKAVKPTPEPESAPKSSGIFKSHKKG